MKKILKVFLYTMIAVLGFSFSNITNVKAATNDAEIIHYWLPGYFSEKNNDGKFSQLSYIYANGEIAYCVEPGLPLDNGTFSSSTSFNIANISEEKKQKLELIAAFGYNLTNHRYDTYYAATQELIWRELGISNITWHTDKEGGGSFDLTRQKNEILRLIDDYNKSISFASNGVIDIDVGYNSSILDENGVLNNYRITSTNADSASISGNYLNIQQNSEKDIYVKLERKDVTYGTSIVYYKPENQKLATFKVSNRKEVTINLKAQSGKVKLFKKGEKVSINNGSYTYDEIPLEGVRYKLYANDDIKRSNGEIKFSKDSEVETFITDKNGYYESGNLLFGKYCIQEVETVNGHILNDEPYCFELTKDNKEIEIFQNNHLPKGKLEFTKTDEETGEFIPNTKIEIYTKDDELVYSGTTNEKGKIVVDDLFTGEFYLIEKEPANGYEKSNDKIYFKIKENEEIVSTAMKNKKKVVVIVPKTYKDDNSKKGLSSLSFIGLASILYGKTKKKKAK